MGQKLWKRLLQTGIILLFSALALHFFGTKGTRIGPLDLEMRMRWSTHGETRLVIPPMGEIKANTHRVPVVFSIQLNRVDESMLQTELSDHDKPADYLQMLLPELRAAFIWFMLGLLMIGAVAGAIAGMTIWGWRNWKNWVVALLIGTAFTGFVLGSITIHYDQKAFAHPRYEGMLEAAPWLLDLVDKGLAQLDSLGKKLEVMAANLNRLFNQVDQLDSLAQADGALKVVHVSDIHNNPAAYDFLQRVVKGFGADLIIDTGDLTDYGTPIEAQLAEALAGVGVPYYFIPGNHDSPEVVERLSRIRGIKVVDGELVSLKGLTILGWGDPAAKEGRLMSSSKQIHESAQGLFEKWQSMEQAPDLVAVHNVATASGLMGKTPLVLHGHDHRARTYERLGTQVVDAGTTGAAGVRALESESPDGVPFSLALLRFDSSGEEEKSSYTLTAVDLISVYSLNGRFILERKVVKGGGVNPAVFGDLANPGAPQDDRGNDS